MRDAFDIQPFVGALPLRFGMSRPEVHSLLGPPEASHPQWDDGGKLNFGLKDHWHTLRLGVGYNKQDAVIHVGFRPGGCDLSFQGKPLWSPTHQPDPNGELLRHDPTPLEMLGSLVFLALGVSTSGYHNDDPDNVAFTGEPQGVWDALQAVSAPPDLSKYRP